MSVAERAGQGAELNTLPLGARLAQQLRLQILSGRYDQDHHLVETRIAADYNVSRGPVRDAFRELERDGLVYPARQGYRVTQLTADDVDEMYTIRGMIEHTAIESALRHQQSWAPLEHIVEAMREAAAGGDQDEFTRLDLAFHRTFCELGGGRRLQAVWKLFEPTLTALFQINPHPAENLVNHAEEHAALWKSLQKNDDAWQQLLSRHLERARSRFLAAHSAASGSDDGPTS